MSPDVIQYQEELKMTATRILKDPYLAEDMVQDTFLYAFENGIGDKQQLLQVIKNRSLAAWSARKREPDSLQTGFFAPHEGRHENAIWKNRNRDVGNLLITTLGEIEHALPSIEDHRGKYLPFVKAREFVQSLDITSGEAWKSYKKENPKVAIPSNPGEVYRREWKGWRDFLGTDFLTFEEFLAFARTVLLPQGVNTPRKFKSHKNLPKHIPTNPNVVYKDDWKGWGYVFCSKRKKPGVIVSYQEARAYVQANLTPKGIDTLIKYKNSALPDFLPASPHEHYKNIGWINSSDYFGTHKVKAGTKKNYLPYKAAREWVRLNLRILGITTGKLYKKYIKGTLDIVDLPPVPAGLPPSPASYYRSVSFSWGDFLGTLRIDGKMKRLYSYRQCKAWNKENLHGQIKGRSEWQKYKKGGYPDLPPYPSQMPLAPHALFKGKRHWVSWEDFLGLPPKPVYLSKTDHKNRKKGKRGFWPYAQARQYMIDVIVPSGITSLKEYLRLDKKPANIPLDPKHYYKGKGWVNAAHFMGFDEANVSRRKVTQDDGKYLTYAEAKHWVHENLVPQGIDSYYLYRQNASTLPNNMPAWPHIYYRDRGWVNIYDFMGKLSPEQRRKANPKKVFMSVDEARLWITTNLPGVDSYEKWVKYRQGLIKGLPDLPPNIPKSPNTAYGRMRVWKGWPTFLAPLSRVV